MLPAVRSHAVVVQREPQPPATVLEDTRAMNEEQFRCKSGRETREDRCV